MRPESAAYLLTLASSLEAAGDPDRALAVLDLAGEGETGTAEALALKGDLLRSAGELQRAAEVFDQLVQREPDHPRARFLSALLGGTPPPLTDSRPAPWPSAFVRLENFLNHAHHEELLELMTSRQDAFGPSTVGTPGINGREPRVKLDSRASLQLAAIDDIRIWMLPLIEGCLDSISARLRVGPYGDPQVDLKCTAYGDQGFFKVHSDSIYHPNRRISFVYYFHHLPKRYSGGALLLYDGDAGNPAKYFRNRFTRLDPLDNSVVFFPSGTFHEVTRVASPSGRLEDARFTLAGHVIAFDAGDRGSGNAAGKDS